MVVVVRALKWNFRPFLSVMFGNVLISSKINLEKYILYFAT